MPIDQAASRRARDSHICADGLIGSDNLGGIVSDQDMSSPHPEWRAASAELAAVLESAARLQELVPDAVLVGESAAALYAGHRDSFDHDHVLVDLCDRFDVVLGALESEGDWVTNRVRPGKLILGRLGDIEAGVRQMIRARPLETVEISLASGRTLRAPTAAEALRVKAFLIVARNQVRDYLDVAALSDRYGVKQAGAVLSGIDEYYTDQRGDGPAVATQVARQLADPRPADASVTQELDAYRNLDARWHDWARVRAACRELVLVMAEG